MSAYGQLTTDVTTTHVTTPSCLVSMTCEHTTSTITSMQRRGPRIRIKGLIQGNRASAMRSSGPPVASPQKGHQRGHQKGQDGLHSEGLSRGTHQGMQQQGFSSRASGASVRGPSEQQGRAACTLTRMKVRWSSLRPSLCLTSSPPLTLPVRPASSSQKKENRSRISCG